MCYIPTDEKYASYLSYLTMDATSQKLEKPNDKLVRMTQPSAKLYRSWSSMY